MEQVFANLEAGFYEQRDRLDDNRRAASPGGQAGPPAAIINTQASSHVYPDTEMQSSFFARSASMLGASSELPVVGCGALMFCCCHSTD